jgi:hypothetical protein
VHDFLPLEKVKGQENLLNDHTCVGLRKTLHPPVRIFQHCHQRSFSLIFQNHEDSPFVFEELKQVHNCSTGLKSPMHLYLVYQLENAIFAFRYLTLIKLFNCHYLLL